MECNFRPHDRDPTTEDMGVVWMGYWAVLEGCGLQHTRCLYGYPVNRWRTKRPPNGTKLDRWPTGGILRPLDKPRPIPRIFDTRSRKKAPDCKTDNGENARMHETNTYANEMHMMT